MVKKKNRCNVCGSKRFTKDGATGRITCEEGHVVQGYLAESQERGLGVAGLSYRRTRKEKKKKKPKSSTHYRGNKGRWIMFEVAQILLRQQVQRIIAVWDLPPELEVVARDLWALYISATDLTPEPLIAQQEEQDFQNKASNKTSQSERSRVNTSPQPNDFDQPLSSSNSSSQEDGSDHSDHDDEFSHHDEEHLEDDLEGPKRTYTGPTRSRGNKGRQSHDPARVFHAHFTLAICYLSCLLLRVPVFMQQILQLAELGAIPFIGFTHTLPKELRAVMSSSVKDVFLPPHVLQIYQELDDGSSFQAWVSKFVKLFGNYGVSFPPINAPPLLVRCVNHMLLPSPFYHAAKKSLFSLDMDLHFLPLDDSRSVRRGGKRSDEPANRHLLSVDAAIAGAVLLCAKLQWGLDDEVRVVPADAAESAWTEMPSQKAWLKALEHLSHLPKVHSEVELLQKNPADYDDDEIDAYLDYCQERLISEERPDRHRHHQRFPLSDMQGRVDRSQYEEAILTLLTKMYDPANRMLHESQGDQEGRSQLLCSERIAYAPKTKSSASPFRAFEIARDRMCELVGYSPDQMNKIVRALEERLLDVFQDPESLSPKQHQSRPPSSASSQEQTFGDGHEWEDQDDSDEDEEAIAATLTQSFNDMHT